MNYDDIQAEWVKNRTAELRQEIPNMTEGEIILLIVELEQKLKKARWLLVEEGIADERSDSPVEQVRQEDTVSLGTASIEPSEVY